MICSDHEGLYFNLPSQSFLTEIGVERVPSRRVSVVLSKPLPRPGPRRDAVLSSVENLCSGMVSHCINGPDEVSSSEGPTDMYRDIPDCMFVAVGYDSDSDSDLDGYDDEDEGGSGDGDGNSDGDGAGDGGGDDGANGGSGDSKQQSPSPLPSSLPECHSQEEFLATLKQTIESGLEYLRLAQDNHGDLTGHIAKIAVAYRVRYQLLRRSQDLEASIEFYSRLIEELPASEKALRAYVLLDLALIIDLQFLQSGDISDLDLVIDYYRQGLQLLPANTKALIQSYVGLTSALDRRRQVLESWEDEKEARELHAKALVISERFLNLIPPEHSDYIDRLVDRIFALGMRSPPYGDLADLMQSNHDPKFIIQQLPSAAPVSSQIQAISLVASSLTRRFRELGEMSDINKAIRFGEEALTLARPNDQECLPELLGNLAVSYKSRLAQTGDNADMDKAIYYNRESVHPRFSYYEGRSCRLTCLANILCTRYELLRDMSDVYEAIRHLLDALSSTPHDSHFYNVALAELASVIARPCELGLADNKLPEDFLERMDVALVFMEEAYNSLSFPDRASLLINYATIVRTRSLLLGSLKGMSRVAELFREVLIHPNMGHFRHASNLYNLANALVDRFRLGRDVSDMDEAISTYLQAEAELPQEHSFHGEIVAALGGAYAEKYTLTKELHDLDQSFANYERTANHPTSSIGFRFKTACRWASDARDELHSSTLRAYSSTLSLLSRYVTTSHTIETQHSRLSVAPNSLALNAASWAISEGHLETAVEFLEQGRAVLWSQVGRYRTPLDRLKEVNPALAVEFRRLSIRLERDVVSHCDTPVGDASEYRSVSSQWDRVVDKIRALDGFSDFLKSTPFVTLQKAAIKGPVIIINFDEYRADAIIVQAASSPTLVPLPLATQDAITSLSSNLTSALKLSEEEFAKSRNSKVIGVLRQIWDIIIHPIVDQLLTTCHVSEGSRVWWCPTSSLWSLPLHAAGPYRKGERNLPDIFVSSYTPTLSSLIQSLKRETGKKARQSLSMLAVVQTQSPGEMPLPSAAEERSLLKEYVPSLNLLDGEQATHDAVLTGFKQCSWVHFACHGYQDPQRPFNSSFALHDQRLPLLDIIQTQSQTAEFAFLSACHSAAVDPKLPNEGIHLAAGLQFSGFKGVVGTMWAMADADGPVVAREFYKYIFRDSEGMVDYEDAAVGLNLAVKVLRREKVPVERWINFIHVGA